MLFTMDAKHRRCSSDPTWRKAKKDAGRSYSCLKRKTMGENTRTKEAHLALKREVLELRDCLEHHFVIRRELEKALTGSPQSCFDSLPHPIKGLIEEIAGLEKEVALLEKYLLSMYRTAVPNPTQEKVNEVEFSNEESEVELRRKPTKLSEAMIQSICFIYGELSDSPTRISDYTATPFIISSLQSSSQNNEWRIPYETFSSFVSSLENNKNCEEFCVPYASMKSVFGISKNPQKISGIQRQLQSFRSLAYQLEIVNPAEMKHEEKLAFWINIHNTLVMHSFLVNGIPKSSTKRASSSLKAAYNIGGECLSVEMIQIAILNCHLPRPRQWLKPLFSKGKLGARGSRHAYAIHHHEPRLYFALCLGNYSDPAVRVYTPCKVFDELEIAREEYIQSNIFMDEKREKILLPKIVDCFAKDLEMCHSGLIEMIRHLMPDRACGKHGVVVEWISHDFSFRYVFVKELC